MERSCDIDYKSRFGRLSFSLRRIVGETLPRIRDWTNEQKKILCENVIDYFSSKNIEIPIELRAIEDKRFLCELGYDETFCRDVGIPYCDFDKYVRDICAAVALWYHDRYCLR